MGKGTQVSRFGIVCVRVSIEVIGWPCHVRTSASLSFGFLARVSSIAALGSSADLVSRSFANLLRSPPWRTSSTSSRRCSSASSGSLRACGFAPRAAPAAGGRSLRRLTAGSTTTSGGPRAGARGHRLRGVPTTRLPAPAPVSRLPTGAAGGPGRRTLPTPGTLSSVPAGEVAAGGAPPLFYHLVAFAFRDSVSDFGDLGLDLFSSSDLSDFGDLDLFCLGATHFHVLPLTIASPT